MSERETSGSEEFPISQDEIEEHFRPEEVSAMQPGQPSKPSPPAFPSAPPVRAGYFATPIQALPGLTGDKVPYFNTLLRIHHSIMPEVFGVDGGSLEVALTAMDGAVAFYLAHTGGGTRRVNQRDGVYPVPMHREFGNPVGGVHYQLPIAMSYVRPSIRYFVEVQHTGDHGHRKVFEHPIIWDGNRIIFDYGTRF